MSYYNYSDGLNKIFLDLYLAKFLDASTKSFFPCKYKKICLYKWKFTLQSKQMMDLNKRFH